MKQFLSLLLILMLVFPCAVQGEALEDEELSQDEITESVMLDDEGNEMLVDEETGEAFLLSDQQQDELDTLDETIDTSVDPDSLEINPNLPDHIVNILLLGTDGRDKRFKTLRESQEADGEGGSKGIRQRADVWMIVSLNTQDGSVKLTSLLRDTYLSVPGYTSKTKITNIFDFANREGNHGANAELCIRTLNHHFALNISSYVAINFYGLVSIIDAIGGVDVDLTRAEAGAINTYLSKHGKTIAKTYGDPDSVKARLEKKAGVQHLSGLQAVIYARLRSIDNDFARTARQRHLMDLLLKTVMKDLTADRLISLVETSIDYTSTNMNMGTLVALARKMIPSVMNRMGSDTLIEQFRIPMDKSYSYEKVNGSSVVFMSEKSIAKNREALHQFIYGSYIPAE